MSYLWVQESQNLYVGDQGPDNSKHLVIKNQQIPDLEEMTQSHHAGGAIGEIEIGGLGVKALASKFKLTGWDPQTLSQFGINSRSAFPFTTYGNVRNKNGGVAVQAKAVMFGRLTKMSASDFKRGDLLEFDYEIKEILHYELWFAGKEKFYWDFFGSIFRIDGVPQNTDELINLAIPSN